MKFYVNLLFLFFIPALFCQEDSPEPPSPPCTMEHSVDDWGGVCPDYCLQKEPPVCTEQLVNACYCDKGFVFESQEYTKCISNEECEKLKSENNF